MHAPTRAGGSTTTTTTAFTILYYTSASQVRHALVVDDRTAWVPDDHHVRVGNGLSARVAASAPIDDDPGALPGVQVQVRLPVLTPAQVLLDLVPAVHFQVVADLAASTVSDAQDTADLPTATQTVFSTYSRTRSTGSVSGRSFTTSHASRCLRLRFVSTYQQGRDAQPFQHL